MIVADETGGRLCKQFPDGTSDPASFTFPIGDNTGTANYSPAMLDFGSSTFSSAVVRVQVIYALHPQNNSQHRITRYWTVTSSGISGFSCDTTFTYVDEDVEGTEASINALKYDSGSGWTVGLGVDAGNNRFSMTVSSFSDFTGGNNPTAVTLARFTATPAGPAIRVEWETATELDNRGFNLYRSELPDGQ